MLGEIIEILEKKEYLNLYDYLASINHDDFDCIFELLERLFYAAEVNNEENLYKCIEIAASQLSPKERVVSILSTFHNFNEPRLLSLMTKLLYSCMDSINLK